MKIILIIFCLLFSSVTAQEHKVVKVEGTVKALLDYSEDWITIVKGQSLRPSDIILALKGSELTLKHGDDIIYLAGGAVLSLKFARRMTLNELLLALAMEDIKNIPSGRKKDNSKNTAVYGKNLSEPSDKIKITGDLGRMSFNGALQLAENGYKTSAVAAASETLRIYPETRVMISERLALLRIKISLDLLEEAQKDINELGSIAKTDKDKNELKILQERINSRILE